MIFPVVILIAVPVIIEALEQNNAARILISKESDCIIRSLLQITEADNVAVGFNGIQDTVGSGVGLNQSVHFEVLVHPQGIQRGCIKTCEEHIYDNQQIHFPVFHSHGQVFVVVLELVRGSIKVRVERRVVILDCTFKEVTGGLVKGIGIEAFLLQNIFGVFLVCGVAENCGNRKLTVALRNLSLELRIILHCHGNGADSEHGIEARHTLALQGIEAVAFGFLVKMLQRVFDDFPNTLWRTHRPFNVDC